MSTSKANWINLLLILVTGIFIFFSRLSNIALIDPDEARYAEGAREMVEKNDYITPTLNYKPRINKPALFYWLIAGSYKFFGVNEFSARFPSAAVAIIGTLLVYFFTRYIYNQKIALMSSLILLTSLEYIIIGRLAIIDMTFTVFLTTTLFLFWLWYEKDSILYLISGFAFMGLSFLAKGPVGFILPVLVMIMFLLFRKQPQKILKFFHPGGIILFLTISLPWYLSCYLKIGLKESISLLLKETSGRFFSGFTHKESILYFFGILIIGFLPFSGYLTHSFISNLKLYLKKQQNNSISLYLITWFSTIFLFFTISKSKLPTYILPIFPAISILVARSYYSYIKDKKYSILTTCALLTYFLLITISVVVVFYIYRNYPASFKNSIIISLLFFSLGLIYLFLTIKRKVNLAFFILCGINIITMPFVVTLNSEEFNYFRSTKNLSEIIEQNFTSGDKLIAYQIFKPSIIFYTHKKVKVIKDRNGLIMLSNNIEASKRIFLFIEKKQWTSLKSEIKKPGQILSENERFYLVLIK